MLAAAAARSKSVSKLVVRIFERPSASFESCKRARWSGKSVAGGARRSITALRTRDSVPGLCVRFSSERSARSNSLLAMAFRSAGSSSGTSPSRSYTCSVRRSNEAKPTRNDTPAPQRNTALPSLTALMRSSGMSVPPWRNLTLAPRRFSTIGSSPRQSTTTGAVLRVNTDTTSLLPHLAHSRR